MIFFSPALNFHMTKRPTLLFFSFLALSFFFLEETRKGRNGAPLVFNRTHFIAGLSP